jgi:large conductance mechanosensitive channel
MVWLYNSYMKELLNKSQEAKLKARQQLSGFTEFIREQGVVGLAVGFILGGAIAKIVSSLVGDILNPLIGLVLGRAGNLTGASFSIGGATITWGNFANNFIDFLVIAAVVYYGVKMLGLDKLDKKKE